MTDEIVIMEKASGKAKTLKPITFANLGVQECKHLERWIENNPEILGAKLLILTSEYDKFDKSKKRLDLLAIDENGKVVVVELKRDASGSLADLQAIRYAAFCSNMTFDEVVERRAAHKEETIEKAKAEIREFVDDPEFATIDKSPRIILAAGSFDDQELTSCVLWLRNFTVDIRCVEIRPYAYEGSGKILLVPRVIIPLPEASQFIVRTENKQATEANLQRSELMYRHRNEQLLKYFRQAHPGKGPASAPARRYMQIRTGLESGIHYEFLFSGRAGNRELNVAIHFETKSKKRNQELLSYLAKHRTTIEKAVGAKLTFQSKRGNWTSAHATIPCEPWSEDVASGAAYKMSALIRVVQPLLEKVGTNQG